MFTQRSYGKACTRRGFDTEKSLHRGAFTQRSLYTQRSFYTQTLLHKETFTHRSFLTNKPLHRGTFTQRNLYAQTRLHTVAFTHRSFCTEKSLPIFYHVSFSGSLTICHLRIFVFMLFWSTPSVVSRCSVRPRFVLAPSAVKQTKREPRNK